VCSCWRRRDGRSPARPAEGLPVRASQPWTSRASVAHATTGVVQASTHHGVSPAWARFWRTAIAVPKPSPCSGTRSRYWLTYSSLVVRATGAARATSCACTTSTSRAPAPSLSTSTCHAHAGWSGSRVRVTRHARPDEPPVTTSAPSEASANESEPAPSTGQACPLTRSRTHSWSSPGSKGEAACCTSSTSDVPRDAGAPPSTMTARRPPGDTSTHGGFATPWMPERATVTGSRGRRRTPPSR
jgi:hypothetical protein